MRKDFFYIRAWSGFKAKKQIEQKKAKFITLAVENKAQKGQRYI